MITAPSALVRPAVALLLVAATAAPPMPARASPSRPTATARLPANHIDASWPRAAAALGRAGRERVAPAIPVVPESTSAWDADSPVPRGRWSWPLDPRPAVVRPFLPPSSPYGAGHRGVDLLAAPGQAVASVDVGTVTHAGVIAGRGTVSVLHASGLRSTYEPVVAVVHSGDLVGRGERLGTVSGVAGHCAPRTCLHVGALRGEAYVDPLQLLGGRRVRLLPLQ